MSQKSSKFFCDLADFEGCLEVIAPFKVREPLFDITICAIVFIGDSCIKRFVSKLCTTKADGLENNVPYHYHVLLLSYIPKQKENGTCPPNILVLTEFRDENSPPLWNPLSKKRTLHIYILLYIVYMIVYIYIYIILYYV